MWATWITATQGCAWCARSVLERHGLDATRCGIIRVRGKSMEPTLPDGCSILSDRTAGERGIYVVRTDAGLIVKRTVRRGGTWEVASDNPAVAARRRPRSGPTCGRRS